MEAPDTKIVVLADDLYDDATHYKEERFVLEDDKVSFSCQTAPIDRTLILKYAQIDAIPLLYRQPDLRLVILGHGDEKSKVISDTSGEGGKTWDAEQFAAEVRKWLVPPDKLPMAVQRISLQMCFGGGNSSNFKNPAAANPHNFEVSPFASFAYTFANIVVPDLAKDVTARADKSRGQVSTVTSTTSLNGVVTGSKITSYKFKTLVADRYHEENDTFVSHKDNGPTLQIRSKY